MSGVTVEDVWASYGAGGLVSDVANVEVELGGHQVEQSDIDELLRGGRESIDRNGQVVLHAHPALYTIDRAQGVQQPIGLFANRLGVDIHVIAADPAPLRNIDTVIRSAHLGVKAIVASPIAAALACLSEEERELGVALIELGADVTNVSVHFGGMLNGRSVTQQRVVPSGPRKWSSKASASREIAMIPSLQPIHDSTEGSGASLTFLTCTSPRSVSPQWSISASWPPSTSSSRTPDGAASEISSASRSRIGGRFPPRRIDSQ